MSHALRIAIAAGALLAARTGAAPATADAAFAAQAAAAPGAAAAAFAARDGSPAFPREEPFVRRPFEPSGAAAWTGSGIAYGPYRDGQFPGGPEPTREQLREDLRILAKRWRMLRLYGALGPSPEILQTIREEGLDMKVVLGVWIEPEETRDERGGIAARRPEKRDANRREIESAVRLAAEYPEIVAAVCAGNETQVAWSDHRCPAGFLIGAIRELRARTPAPVTAADDFNFWNKPESAETAREVDFAMTHHHPMWNGAALEDALPWVRKTLGEVRAAHPDLPLVLGETGWATRKHTEGDQARLIQGTPGEAQQKLFFDRVTRWAAEEGMPLFYFEAFDENWKGGSHPDEVEKHWGLFRADRTPKKAVSDGD